MKEKIKLFIIFGLFIFIIYNKDNINEDIKKESSTSSFHLKSEDNEWLKNNVKNEAKVYICNSGKSKFIYNYDNITQGIYNFILNKFNDDVVKTIITDNIQEADIIIGDSINFGTNKYLVSNSFYNQIFYIYTYNKTITNINDLYSKKVGVINTISSNTIANYYGVDLHNSINYYNSATNLHKALYAKKVDAIIVDKEIIDKNFYLNMRCIPLQLMSRPHVIAVKNNNINSKFVQIINKWISCINKDEEIQKLIKKEVLVYYRNIFPFTVYEKKWLAEHPEVAFAFLDEYEPYHIYDKGQYSGISKDVLDDLSIILNIKFSIDSSSVSKDANEIFNACQKNKILCIPFVGKSSNNKEVLFTDALFKTDLQIINKENNLFVEGFNELECKKIIYSYDWIGEILDNNIINPTLIKKNSFEEVLASVNKEKNMYTLAEPTVINYYIKSDKYSYRVTGKIEDAMFYYFAVNKDNPIFVSILNKAMPLININQYYYKYYSFNDPTYNYYYILILIIILIITIFFIVIYIKEIIKELRINSQKKINLEKLNNKYRRTFYKMINMLTEAGKITKKEYTYSKRIGCYAEVLAKEIGIKDYLIEEIIKVAPLYDIGYIVIDNNEFDDNRIEESNDNIKAHIDAGYLLVKKLELGTVAENIVRYHHEFWNGEGYPNEKKGDDIPIESRIIHLAHVYDFLRYKNGYSHEKAITIIKEKSGQQFDSRLVDVFVEKNIVFKNLYNMSLKTNNKLEEIK